MTPLVDKLSKGQHPVSLIRYKSASDVKEALDRGLVLVKFTDTQGGTEIGVAIDQSGIELKSSEGKLDLRGSLTLDYQPVRCVATIDMETLTGYGSLEPVQAG
jgi:hypothetical protein